MAGSVCNMVKAVAFVNKYRGDCEKIAQMLDVPVENILGLAAQESQYGDGRIASEYNNYFSMHAPAPLQTGETHPLGSSTTRVAVYSSFFQCGHSFALRFGHAVRGKKDPQQFAQALIHVGFNSGSSSNGGRSGFADYLVRIINLVRRRMECAVK